MNKTFKKRVFSFLFIASVFVFSIGAMEEKFPIKTEEPRIESFCFDSSDKILYGLESEMCLIKKGKLIMSFGVNRFFLQDAVTLKNLSTGIGSFVNEDETFVISVPAFSNDIFYLSVENLKNPKKDRIIKFKVGGKIQEPRLVYMGEAKIKNPEKKAKRFEINDFKKDDLLDNSVRVACCTQKTLVTGYGFPFKDLQIFNIKPNRELKHNHYCLYTKYKKRLNEGESFCLIEISNNGKFLALLNNKLEIKFFNTEEKVFFEEFIDLKKFKEKEETDFKFVFSKNSRFLILAIIITYEYEVDPELRIKVFSVENSKEINEVVYRVENSPDEDYLKIKQMKCSPSGRFLGILLSDGKLYPDFGLREILYKKN